MIKPYSKLHTLVALFFACVMLLSGCASTTSSVERDPYESVNRKIFAFNDGIDRYVLRPTAKGYKKITPDPVETSVTSFFSNLLEVRNTANSLLQGKLGKAGKSTGRFLINSTFGLAGLFDVASKTGLQKELGEDFGQTLNAWGVPQGPYLVLPFLGPSTASAFVGRGADWYLDPVNSMNDSETQWALQTTEIIDLRARLLQTDELVSGDRYLFIRDAYLQRRDFLIHDGAAPVNDDDFGDDFGDSFGDGFDNETEE